MKRNAKFKRSMEAVALILPTVLIYTLVIAYPLLNMTYTSFFTWDGIPTSPYIFVGWENYHKFFTDIIALTSLKNVIIIMLVSVLGVIPIAFFLATVISKRFFANRVVKAVYFLPVIINKVAIGLMFTFILYPKVGPFVKLLEFFGLNSNVNVLGNMDTSIWVCAFVVLWCNTGLHMILFSAAMTSIPAEIYESAKIDGAPLFKAAVYYASSSEGHHQYVGDPSADERVPCFRPDRGADRRRSRIFLSGADHADLQKRVLLRRVRLCGRYWRDDGYLQHYCHGGRQQAFAK